MPDQPNILYFVCHDLGRHLPLYGAPFATPNFSRLAAEGITFDQAFCNSPACSPSRACAMSGQYAHTSGAVGLSHMGWPLPAEIPTTIDYLRELGYETAHSGLAHERLPGGNNYDIELEEAWNDWNAHVAVDKAIGYLESRDRSKPFYLNIATQQVHACAWKFAETMYGGVVPPEEVWVPPSLPDNAVVREQLGRFQASIRYLDEQFGRLMNTLEQVGELENTIVVFTTDHGICGLRAKGSLYDLGTEIALIMRMPQKQQAGTRVSHLIQNIDFNPTFIEAAGGTPHPRLQGRSFLGLLTGESYEAHREIYIERNFHGERDPDAEDFEDRFDPSRSIRTDDYHYIRFFRPEANALEWNPFEIPPDYEPEGTDFSQAWPPSNRKRPNESLFHIRRDPNEFIDVSERPEFASVKAELSARLDQWMEETDDFAPKGTVPERLCEPGWGEFDKL